MSTAGFVSECKECCSARTKAARAITYARRGPLMLTCSECGCEAERKSNFQKYCGVCSYLVEIRNASVASTAKYWANKSEKTYDCISCGVEFVGRKGRNMYCSSECWRSAGVQGRISSAMRTGICRGLSHGEKSSRKTFEILGYSLDQLKSHIERQFSRGMSWANYGVRGWHIDHRVPLTAFSYSSMECQGFKDAWALTNLQPLWSEDNWSKNGQITVLL